MRAAGWDPRPDRIRRFFEVTLDEVRILADPAVRIPEIAPSHSCAVLALGKAAVAQAGSTLDRLRSSGVEPLAALAVTKLESERPNGLEVLVGDHPIPSLRSDRAARRLMEVAAHPVDHQIVLVSGGGSSLAAAIRPPATLEDCRALVRACFEAGVPIEPMNQVRRAIDHLKNGGLLRASAAGRIHGLITVDVPSRDPAAVASGPLSWQRVETPFVESLLDRLTSGRELDAGTRDRISTAVGEAATESRPADRAELQVCADDRDLLRIASRWLEAEGFEVRDLNDQDRAASGSTASGVERFDEALRPIVRTSASEGRRRALLLTGELEVGGLDGRPHRGGRCSHFVVELGRRLFEGLRSGADDVIVVAMASDGDDGQSHRSGGYLDADGFRRIEAHQPGAIDRALQTGSTAELLEAHGLSFGPRETATNLMDLYAVLVAPRNPCATRD